VPSPLSTFCNLKDYLRRIDASHRKTISTIITGVSGFSTLFFDYTKQILYFYSSFLKNKNKTEAQLCPENVAPSDCSRPGSAPDLPPPRDANVFHVDFWQHSSASLKFRVPLTSKIDVSNFGTNPMAPLLLLLLLFFKKVPWLVTLSCIREAGS